MGDDYHNVYYLLAFLFSFLNNSVVSSYFRFAKKDTLKIAKRKRVENKLFIENVNKQRDALFIIRFLEQLFHIQSSVWQLSIHSAQWEEFAALQNDRYNKDKTCKERQVGRGQIYNMYITISIRKS